ncbi:MAG: hypothetical protein ACPGED_05510, partial [Flavobacteriales bacterium]
IDGTGVELNNVELNNSNGLSLLDNMSLNGQLVLTAGTFATGANTLTLTSNAAGTASIGEIQTSADFSGTVELQRFIPTGVSNWVNISAPLTSQTIASWDDDIITTGFTGSQWPLYPFNNIQSYDETVVGGLNDGWTETADITDELADDRGYMAYMLGTTQLLDLTGSIQKGSVQVSLNYSPGGGVANDGWELCSNIYPCDIHFDQLYALSNNIGDTYYVYDAETGNYATYTVGLGGSAGEVISSSQSFWVQTTGAGAYIQFEESIKSETSSAFERFETAQPYIVLELEGISKTHEAVVTFSDQFTSNFDLGSDALKLGSMDEFSPEISTMSADGQMLTVNRMPWNNGIIEVPVHLHLDSLSDYSLRLKTVEHLPENTCLALVNLESGESWPFNASEEIEFVIDEHKNEVMFAIQLFTAATISTQNASCSNQSNGAVEVINELGNGSVQLFNLNHTLLSEETIASGETFVFENLNQGDYFVEVVNSELPCAQQGFWVYVDADPGNSAEVSTLIDSCNESGLGSILVSHTSDINYQLTHNGELLSQGQGSTIELIDLNSALLYELEITDECGTSSQEVYLYDPTAVNAEIQGEFTVVIENGISEVNYQANSSNAISNEWYLDGELVGSGELLNLGFEETGDFLLTLNSTGETCSNSTSEWIQVEQANGIDSNQTSEYTVQMVGDHFVLTGDFNQTTVQIYNSTSQSLSYKSQIQ